GMTRPIKVIGFLDFFGNWDPSLAFVMLGAIGVYFVANRWSQRMASPFFAGQFSVPTRREIDARLILGSAMFGIGWGMAGFCPGPAVVSLASGTAPAALFTISMCSGIFLHSWSLRVGQPATPVMGIGADA